MIRIADYVSPLELLIVLVGLYAVWQRWHMIRDAEADHQAVLLDPSTPPVVRMIAEQDVRSERLRFWVKVLLLGYGVTAACTYQGPMTDPDQWQGWAATGCIAGAILILTRESRQRRATRRKVIAAPRVRGSDR